MTDFRTTILQSFRYPYIGIDRFSTIHQLSIVCILQPVVFCTLHIVTTRYRNAISHRQDLKHY